MTQAVEQFKFFA